MKPTFYLRREWLKESHFYKYVPSCKNARKLYKAFKADYATFQQISTLQDLGFEVLIRDSKKKRKP